MSDERELVIETASGKKVKTTLDAVRSLTARLGEVAPKMRDIVSVERKEVKGVPTVAVAYEYATATDSGHPDTHRREVLSSDPWHPDFRVAWGKLEDELKDAWGASSVGISKLAWKDGDCTVHGVVLGLGKIRGGISIKASLDGGEGGVGGLVLEIEREAFAYADRTKREQMELGL